MDPVASIRSFQSDMLGLVRKLWPTLVAQELMKLQSKPNDRHEKIFELRRQGLTQTAIAEQLGLSQGHISNILKASAAPKPAKSSKPSGESTVPVEITISFKDALAKHGTKAAAARALGIAESTFRDRLAKELAA